MSVFKLNDQAPDFELTGLDRKEYHLSDMLEQNDEKWFLLIYFRGSWCPACMEELDELEDTISYFDKHNISLLTITHDEKTSLEKMMKEHQFSFPVLLDEDFSFLKSYDVYYHGEDAPYEDHGKHAEPAYFLLNEEGKVLYQQRQTNPFGRPHAKELRKTIQYIRRNLK